VVFLVLSIIGLTICYSSASDSKYFANAQLDQVLYFQSQSSDYNIYYNKTYVMNINISNGQATSKTLNFGLAFVSPPLAEQFTFPYYVGITIYHEKVLHRGDFTLYWTLGWISTTGAQVSYSSDFYTMDYDTTSTTISAHFDATLLKGERLFVTLSLTNSLGSYLYMYWGNSSFPSGISYQGNAVYIPEFPLFLLLPLFMIATLLAVIVYRRKYH
jgi:hypothetical protein